MEAIFDNKANVLNARIRVIHDNSAIYSLATTSGIRGRKVTVLQDTNPGPRDVPVVGVIHWREKSFEILGHKKPVAEIRRRAGSFFRKCAGLCFAHPWKGSIEF